MLPMCALSNDFYCKGFSVKFEKLIYKVHCLDDSKKVTTEYHLEIEVLMSLSKKEHGVELTKQ